MWYALGIFAALAVIGFILLIISAEDFSRPIDFTKPILHKRPNQFLACPQGYCADKPHHVVATYPVSVSQLEQLFEQGLAREQRLEHLEQHADSPNKNYQQSSAFFKFPDRITVKFIDLKKGQSSLAIYSRAKYGRRDFDVNKARVKRWLKRLDEQLASHTRAK